ncbi:haloalkane dehalogenase [Aliiroseovarius sp. F47248L]|uniref:haloalkane dehalogenase n=1 Tax=Aliiroseovarius sp. F47248L TaxID=2926420 RepID=UPI001FF2EEDB|nr:haloalkane dehalogenase [Aliiroseovarius sp. F47248L]MCK0138485.1 haloalkane dehalogenase [Aliiroseovarius sp. F47248L]
MDYLRTPDDRFQNLADFDFAPNYLTVNGGLRMHYLDEGPPDAHPILVMHGEPSWCYLYRHMIPPFTQAGHRVVAPDLIGFGRSDKPVAREDYTYQRHLDWMTDCVTQLDLREITLVCQDWGGLIGLRLVANMPDRFARLVIANTALPTGDHPVGAAFESWRDYSQCVEDFNAGRIVRSGTVTKLSDAEVAAYNAPFPDARYQAGARQFPLLVPDNPDDPASGPNRAAWEILCTLPIPALTVFGAEDKIMAGGERVFQKCLPGAKGQRHRILQNAGHFLQEDVPVDLAQATLDFIAAT